VWRKKPRRYTKYISCIEYDGNVVEEDTLVKGLLLCMKEIGFLVLEKHVNFLKPFSEMFHEERKRNKSRPDEISSL